MSTGDSIGPDSGAESKSHKSTEQEVASSVERNTVDNPSKAMKSQSTVGKPSGGKNNHRVRGKAGVGKDVTNPPPPHPRAPPQSQPTENSMSSFYSQKQGHIISPASMSQYGHLSPSNGPMNFGEVPAYPTHMHLPSINSEINGNMSMGVIESLALHPPFEYPGKDNRSNSNILQQTHPTQQMLPTDAPIRQQWPVQQLHQQQVYHQDQSSMNVSAQFINTGKMASAALADGMSNRNYQGPEQPIPALPFDFTGNDPANGGVPRGGRDFTPFSHHQESLSQQHPWSYPPQSNAPSVISDAALPNDGFNNAQRASSRQQRSNNGGYRQRQQGQHWGLNGMDAGPTQIPMLGPLPGSYIDPYSGILQQFHHPNAGATTPGPPIQTTPSNKGPDGANLFIFHIPNNFTNQDMYRLFFPYGKLLSVRIMVERDTGRSRGFGFVSYDSPESAAMAIKELNGHVIGNKRLKVQHKQIRVGENSGESGGRNEIHSHTDEFGNTLLGHHEQHSDSINGFDPDVAANLTALPPLAQDQVPVVQGIKQVEQASDHTSRRSLPHEDTLDASGPLDTLPTLADALPSTAET
mmetsp:Transcript_24517/g.30124  ORF Transcript_24517/g.30124 Transcript_24517/m.30124 type:complete len:579 (-) Transcript_24517:285-2021(-)